MAQWNAIKLTRKGLQLQAVMQTGAIPLSVTRAAIGNGTPGENIELLTNLVSEITDVDVSIISNDVKDSFAQMVIRIQNGESAFYIKELGIFAEDENGNEILYAYTYADAADYMPAITDGNMTQDITVAVVIGNASEVKAIINTQQGVTLEQLNASIEDVKSLITSEEQRRKSDVLAVNENIASEKLTRESADKVLQNRIDEKADINSPIFTGPPKATTAAGGDNSTRIATTAFVKNAIASKADTISPVFTGSPKAPTAPKGSNSTLIATTAFVNSAIENIVSNAYEIFKAGVPDYTAQISYDNEVPWVYLSASSLTNNTGWMKFTAPYSSSEAWCIYGDCFEFYDYVTGKAASFSAGDTVLVYTDTTAHKNYIMPSDITWAELFHAASKNGI